MRAVPSDVALPPIWLLGSSGYSAELAAAAGLGFAFAHHFAEHDAGSAMLSYREHFKPSETLPSRIHPRRGDDRGRHQRRGRVSRGERLLALRPPFQGGIPAAVSPEEAAAYPYTPVDRHRIERHRERLIVGSPDSVKSRLLSLAKSTRADELMITTMTYDHAARRRSYELLADAFATALVADLSSPN